MRERIARAWFRAEKRIFCQDGDAWDLALHEYDREAYLARADAVLDALREPSMEVLQAGYEAMFEDKWDGTQAPMMGAGYDAMIERARDTPNRLGGCER